ncbi:ergothioneine biosynthesis protein EgtC [Actinoalloteichus hymeniacidonis]|uniref:Gamma-glutamyl-hercynylcysteine sulfoxide hydrolase n=1 Tax=Actinoalloteichus hymeniacidonis TaxID=340345 RepID=A0AAC9HQ67_9PSEU|nr:ergothioneine biosynthesis protein EgtC [Actinoalloteichus hymeniacidonis]AOS62976.1 ergothioneine biosynthesis protein EgtC [Actinoalloteichus hymeniacidonis]MBB5908989.1 glutamine amidotransferase [Actinoalloteichus hymeniacidonis]
MCRHLAYLGPATSLAALIFEGANSLERQSWAPTMMRQGGTVNVDGFGVGWFPAAPDEARADVGSEADAPLLYRRTGPIWNDHGFAEMSTVVGTRAALAAVRSATVGMPISEEACAPFRHGRWLFSHNGLLPGWPDSATRLIETLPTAALATSGATDSALLWAWLRARLDAGDPPASAVRDLVGAAAQIPGSRLNLLLTDGSTVVASTWTHSLFVQSAPGRLMVSSEPLDTAEGWTEVPDASLLVATRDEIDITPIHPAPSRGRL